MILYWWSSELDSWLHRADTGMVSVQSHSKYQCGKKYQKLKTLYKTKDIILKFDCSKSESHLFTTT